ncbi:MAG: hypothetical protein J6A07_04175 [Firmicutes bacterium]|nr:hypothetical protein [Bacillota bacterium]
MSAFDLLTGNDCDPCTETAGVSSSNNTLKDECVISLKVYDFCRLQDCLTGDVLGPARAASDATYCDITVNAGDILTPPADTGSVSIENLNVTRVIVVSKKPSPFRPGYWDVELKFIFNYRLIFRDVNGDEICNVLAQNSYNNKLTLFGSISTETLVSTDLFVSGGGSTDMSADPFVLVESKAVSLAAELVYNRCCCPADGDDPIEAVAINVTIGLFAIVKLFRLVNLNVRSKGFCIPDECEDVSALDACDFFDSLDFPMDIFAPPQRAEFAAGVSSNIPAVNSNSNNRPNKGCTCGCKKNNQ